MRMVTDIGNTNIVLGIYDNSELIHKWQIESAATKTSDEYRILLLSFLKENEINPDKISAAAVSSVVPQLSEIIECMMVHAFEFYPLFINPFLKTGLSFAVENRREIGSDLLANAAAAYHLYKTASIVIDFGTALTFTAVSSEGVFKGVSIAPGINTAKNALIRQTASLPDIPLSHNNAYIGTDTVSALQSGIVGGYIGLIEHIIAGMEKELGENARIIATGGLSRTIAPLLKRIDMQAPWLTLEGIRIIAEMNEE